MKKVFVVLASVLAMVFAAPVSAQSDIEIHGYMSDSFDEVMMVMIMDSGDDEIADLMVNSMDDMFFDEFGMMKNVKKAKRSDVVGCNQYTGTLEMEEMGNQKSVAYFCAIDSDVIFVIGPSSMKSDVKDFVKVIVLTGDIPSKDPEGFIYLGAF